jgi:alpha-tubulin suppressor-like RCC1 family protein
MTGRKAISIAAVSILLAVSFTSLILHDPDNSISDDDGTQFILGSGGGENNAAVSAGNEHSLTLKDDGTVWAWGSNGSGRLGDGTTMNRSVPVQVSGLTDITAISAGGSHSLALKDDGTVWAWGNNGFSQLGTEQRRIGQYPYRYQV